MISIETINAQLIERIKTAFPGIEFTAQEKLEEIRRPAFKLILDEIKAERYTIGSVKRTFPAELVYYAENKQRPKLECLGVYEPLEALLLSEPYVTQLESAINSPDAVLVIDFDITEIGDLALTEDASASGSGEDMEILDYQEDLI